jgi:hypothetical protein
MVDASAQREKAREFDAEAGRIGLALLALQASASDRLSEPGWINRRVEHLEFIDTRAVRWLVSIDFDVPKDARDIQRGEDTFRLVPITSLGKTNLVAFSLRDEESAAVWMPTSRETTHYLVSALIVAASQLMSIKPQEVPLALINDLDRIVSEDPRELQSKPSTLIAAAALNDAEKSWHFAKSQRRGIEDHLSRIPFWQFRGPRELRRQRADIYHRWGRALSSLLRARDNWNQTEVSIRQSARLLMENLFFRNIVEQLAQNFIVHVGVKSAPGTRRIIKLTYESYAGRHEGTGEWYRKFFQSLGWRLWQFQLLIGARGGSFHLEVTAPPGVDIVGITADRVWAPAPDTPIGWRRRLKSWLRSLIYWEPIADVAVPGHTPRVHINPPDAAFVRYRAAIFVRVSRPGWLTASWGVTFVIGAAIVAGWRNLPVFFSNGATENTAIAAQAGTAAILLLTLLGVIATMLLRPGEHPLASRLLRTARLLVLVDAAVVLVSVGYLVLHQHSIPLTVWTWLTRVVCVVFVLFTISWLVPAGRPRRRE